MNISGELEKIGLSEKEAAVYVAALELGPTTALSISRKTGIKRTTVYVSLDALQKRGLVEIQLQGLKRKFAAANPNQFEAIISEHKKKFDTILPDLLALYKLQGSRSQIKYYEGTDGVKTVYETILREIKSGEPYYVITDLRKWLELDREWFEGWVERRLRKSLDARIILQNNEWSRTNKQQTGALPQQIKIINNEINADISVCPQRYVLHNFLHPISAIVVENKEIVQTQLALFRSVWDSLPD